MQPLTFDNQFTARLPDDGIEDNYRRQISGALYSRVRPESVKAPQLIAWSQEVADSLGYDAADVNSPTFAQVFSGNQLLPDMDPHATCYGGHQFGNWAGQLGDGRAINLGQAQTKDGLMMLQLKGAGPTPYSRTADGLAVLRSSVREFLCSEAMYHLGIPTTRALSLVGTGEAVVRDMLYDGNPAAEPGAVVCRVSPSFIRFGHFELLAARQEHSLLKELADFVIEQHFPHLNDKSAPDRYVVWFNEICTRTADMIAGWMRVGFVHGVMNTDNMSILGETIDYGPYGWLEDFDPDWTPNTTDAQHRRYRYSNQPGIAQWNLMQLANALVPLVNETAPLEAALTDYATYYQNTWQDILTAKLGLASYDDAVANGLLNLLSAHETDMTLFYRGLAATDPESRDSTLLAHIQPAFYSQPNPEHLQKLELWFSQYKAAHLNGAHDNAARIELMQRTNPKFVLRNYLAQLAIDEAEQGHFERTMTTLQVLRQPYAEQPEYEDYAEKRPEWARTRVGCSMLSCSS